MKQRLNMILVAAERDLRHLVSDQDDVTELRHIRAADLGRALSSADGNRLSGFARMIAVYIEMEWRKGGYDRLTLVANPSMLGELRQELPERLRDRIAAVLDRELIDRPLRDIARQLRSMQLI